MSSQGPYVETDALTTDFSKNSPTLVMELKIFLKGFVCPSGSNLTI
jgi:hypothetical protein